MTGDLLARCREALAESDRIAQAWPDVLFERNTAWVAIKEGGSDFHGFKMGWTVDGMGRYGFNEAEARFLESNDPSTRLALNRALSVVLDGITATLKDHADHEPSYLEHRGPLVEACDYCVEEWPCPDLRRATASLSAIAAALDVQEDGQ